jgi:molybdenum cofactor cytidylyltransferase
LLTRPWMRPHRGPQTAAILLAAGESTRMGQPKQLLAWAGTTLVEWQIEQLQKAGADTVVVVLGSYLELVEPKVLSAGARPVVNDGFRLGRATSLRAGALEVNEAAGLIVVLSVDQPRPSWVTAALLARASAADAQVVIPAHKGSGGHPVVLKGALLSELRTVSEETFGLRAVVDRHLAETERVQFANSCVIVDLNTPSEYEAALAAYNRGDWEKDSSSPVTGK